MIEMIITAAVAAMLTVLKCAYQAQSIKETTSDEEKHLNPFTVAFSIILHGVICVVLMRYAGGEMLYSAIYICWIILGIIAALSIFNREGGYRRDSWNCLILLYGLVLTMSLAKRADAGVLTTVNVVMSAIVVIIVLFVNVFACYCYENGVFKAEAKSSH